MGVLFGEGWGAVGKWKAIWRIVPLKKILVTPLALSIIIKKMKNYYFVATLFSR